MAWFADELVAASGGDFQTMVAWEADHQGDNLAGTDGVRARVKGTLSDTGSLYIGGWQAGQSTSGPKIVITAESGCGISDRGTSWHGESGSGDAAVLVKAIVWFEVTNPLVIDVYNIEMAGNSFLIDYCVAGSQVRIWNVFIRNCLNGILVSTSLAADTNIYVANVLMRNMTGYIFWPQDANAKMYCWNVTIDKDGSNYGVVRSAGLLEVRNMVVINCNTDDFDEGLDEDYCAAEDTSPDGAHSIDSIVEADNFTDVSNDDYTIKDTDADLYHAGADQPAWFDTLTGGKDIRGVNYHATTPSIGCFEYAEAGGAYTLTCDQGSFTLSGQTINLKFDRKLVNEYASYTLSGQVVNLNRGRTLISGSGSFTLSGQNLDLKLNRLLDVDYGSFSLSGQDVALKNNRRLLQELGSYVLSGQDLSLEFGRVLNVEYAQYALSGQDVALIYTPAGVYTLSCEHGNFILSGQSINLRTSRILPAEYAQYTLTGQSVNFNVAKKILAEHNVFVVSGQDVTFIYVPLNFYTLVCAVGNFVQTGQNVTLQVAKTLQLESGSYTLTGQDMIPKIARFLAALVGLFSVTGKNVILRYSGEGVFYHTSITLSDAAVVTLSQADNKSDILRIVDNRSNFITLLDTVAPGTEHAEV